MSTEKRIVLITGANTGIGYTAAEALWNSPIAYHIIVAGRNGDKVSSAVATLTSSASGAGSSASGLTVDVTSDASISEAVATVTSSFGRLDALVNNAGAQFDQVAHEGQMSVREAFNASWDVNVTSAFLMTHAFAGLLIKSQQPKLLFVTSGLASLAEEASSTTPAESRRGPMVKGWPKPETVDGKRSYVANNLAAYRSSKVGLNFIVLHWAKTLAPDGVKVFSISPGFLATNLGGNPEAMKAGGDPKLGGQLMKDVIEGKRDADAGLVVRRDSVQAW